MNDKSSLEVSIIIPTYNRRLILRETLSCLCRQTFPVNLYEVIVIDDCSMDGTREYLRSVSLPVNLRYFLNGLNLGRAKTRNIGIREAEGRYVLMLDDDIWAAAELIEKHYEEHRRQGGRTGVVGAILAAPSVPASAVNQYVNNHHVWCYNEMAKHKRQLPYNFCKTANLSFRRDLLLNIGLFNEEFVHYGGEDTDLGYRLTDRDIKLIFVPEAVGYHYHDVTVDSLVAKELERGRSVVLYQRLHPGGTKTANGFFTPYYHKGLNMKTLLYNFAKFFLFMRPAMFINKLFIKLFDKNKALRFFIAKYFVPLLKAQYLRHGLREVSGANRD